MGLINQNPAYNIVQNQLFSFTKGETLAECEADIEMTEKMSDAMKGERLGRIKSQKLYKEKFGTWEEYCQRRWSWTPQHANRLIDFAETCMLIKSEPTGSVLPERESQTRALNTLPDEQKTEVWAKAVEAAKGAQPTAEQVKEAAKRNGYVMRYCPNCNHEQHIHASYKHVTVKCPQCHKEAYCDTEWLTQPKTTEYTKDTTRYCPNCLHEQSIKPKAMNNNNDIQCSECKMHHRAKTWLNATERLLKIQTKEKAKTESRYCPKCGEDKQEFTQERLTKIAQMTQCKKCSHRCAPKYWTTEPKTIQTRYCPYCYEEKPISTADIQNQWYLKCKNRACGKETMAGNWLTEPKNQQERVEIVKAQYNHRPMVNMADHEIDQYAADLDRAKQTTHQLTTGMYCPSCHQKQDILTLWLENESIIQNSMIKCEQCQNTIPLKTWRKELIKPVTIITQEVTWTEEDLRQWRGELKKMFSNLINQHCTSKEAWYKFDQIFLKLHQHFNTQTPEQMDNLIAKLTAA